MTSQFFSHSPTKNRVQKSHYRARTLTLPLLFLLLLRWLQNHFNGCIENGLHVTGLELLMENLKHLIYGNDNPLNNSPSVLSERPQFQLLFEELGSIIQTLSNIHYHHYLMDLVDRNLVIVAKRKFNGDVKACKLHDLVRELCLQKAKEERLMLRIESQPFCSQVIEIITPYKQCRVFTNQDIYVVNFAHPPTPTTRSLLCFHKSKSLIYDIAEYFRSFALLSVLDLRKCELIDIPLGIALLVHLRYLAIWYSYGFPHSVCNLWSLQTLIVKTNPGTWYLPNNISDLVNLKHLWSNRMLSIPSIKKPMNLQSISNVVLGDGVDNFHTYFPRIKKLAFTCKYWEDKNHFELLPYLETLKLSVAFYRTRLTGPKHQPTLQNHISFPRGSQTDRQCL